MTCNNRVVTANAKAKHLDNRIHIHLFQLDSRLIIMENCLDRLDAVFMEKPLPMDGTASLPDAAAHEIEYDHVSFAYGEETILHDICFTADRGQMSALVGESGSIL